ncbi:hypothetical protein LTR56_008802 [Elasticomyces elasticus]|nr:hypothetical protein LTR22_021703 [Elasticomyces elasticus]KAK3645924.1 hypothetical protein LTR56_008802 [Elasticomyces elasticus]KAK5765877.1 hypothetical protein LTS12_003884 [Elasticomyces elasticus]
MADPRSISRSGEMSLADVRALINTYGDLDRDQCKDAMVKVAKACNAYAAIAVVMANELQDLSMEKGQARCDLSKTERNLVEQNAKLVRSTNTAANYARQKVDRLAAIREMCPELENNNSLPQAPARLKVLKDLFQKCGYQLACCFLRDAMYRRFLTAAANPKHLKLGQLLSTKDIWIAGQSHSRGRPVADAPARPFEQKDGVPHSVSARMTVLKELVAQVVEPTPTAPNTSRPDTMPPQSAGTGDAIDTAAREHDNDSNETPFRSKRVQPARKARTVKPTQKASPPPILYTKGGTKRPAPPPEPMPEPKRQAAHSPSAPQRKQVYTHLSAPTPSPITPAIARPRVPELMARPQNQRSHTLFSSPQHAQSRSGAPMPSSMMPEVARPNHYSKATLSGSYALPAMTEEPAEADEAVLDGHANAHAQIGRSRDGVDPGPTGALQQTSALQEDSEKACTVM